MRKGRDRAFSLIEVLIISTIVSILAVLAVVGYRRWIKSSRIMEAQNMIENIRSAQESFKSENGGYLGVSNATAIAGPTATPTQDYPAPTPGAFKTAWGADCGYCVAPNAWKKLGVQPTAPVIYGYAVLATNNPADSPPDILVNGVASSLTAMKGAPWYVIEADADPQGTGSFTKIFGLSGNNQIFINGDTQ